MPDNLDKTVFGGHSHEDHSPQGSNTFGGENHLDPAHKSLSDALRLSFTVLKGVMILLIIGFISTGVEIVEETEKGIRLTFGKVRDAAPLESGPHFSWPNPVGEFVQVDTSSRSIDLRDAFWLGLSAEARSREYSKLNRRINQGLRPGDDGSVITADLNLAHTRWKVIYKVIDPASFIQNIAGAEDLEVIGSDSRNLVSKAIERGVVRASAQLPLDDVITSREIYGSLVKEYAQNMLDKMQTGLQLETVSCVDSQPPQSILEDYSAVNKALSNVNKQIEQARDRAANELNRTAGSYHRQLTLMISIYEVLIDGGQPPEILVEQLVNLVPNPDEMRAQMQTPETCLAAIDIAFLSPAVGGEVAMILAQARQEADTVLANAESETKKFNAFYAGYKKSPNIVKMGLWQATMKKVWAGDFERFFLSPATQIVDIELNRNPKINREQRIRATREEQMNTLNKEAGL